MSLPATFCYFFLTFRGTFLKPLVLAAITGDDEKAAVASATPPRTEGPRCLPQDV